jgi:DNA-binding transcriptional MocR family regulator
MAARPEPPLRYERVADTIERQIGAGVLAPDERLPSLRAMSLSAGVSIGTVVQAYAHLESRGLVTARPRSGYFVSRAAEPRVSPPRRQRARRVRSIRVASKVIDTVLDSMTRSDIVAFNSAVAMSAGRINGRLNGLARRVLRAHPGNPNEFVPPPGHAGLRREIAKRMSLHGAETEARDVVITNGTVEAITLALRTLCRAGDTVLVETPTYFGILQIIEHLSLKIVEVPNHATDGLDVAAIANVVERMPLAAAVLQSNFNNPTGALTPDDNKRKIVAMLTGARVPVIEDDVYGDLHFGAERPHPLAAFDDTGLVVTCGSISKTVALGYRLGWAVSPRYAAEIARAKFFSSVAAPTLQQHVMAKYFAAGIHDRHLRRVRQTLAANCRRFIEGIARHFPEGTRVTDPAGGVVLWVELPREVDGVALFERALAAGIGIAPGIIFSAKGEYRNFIRLSAGIDWTPDIEAALARLGRLSSASAPNR